MRMLLKVVKVIVGAGFLFVAGVFAIILLAPEPPRLTPEQQAENERIRIRYEKLEAKFGKRPFVWETKVKVFLVSRANDPDSVKVLSCTELGFDKSISPLGWTTLCEYTAKNGFGGTVRSSSFFVILNSEVIGISYGGKLRK